MAAKRTDLRDYVKSLLSTCWKRGSPKALGRIVHVKGPDGKQYAAKVCTTTGVSHKEEEYMVSELTFLSRFNHENIVRHYDGWEEVCPGGFMIYILMEYFEMGDLRHYINITHPDPLTESEAGNFLAQIACGLQHIHEYNVLHRNLKTNNIMVTRDRDKLVLKISDFGMSKVLSGPDAFARSVVGTPYFMSPEILQKLEYNQKTDIWSLGCIIYEVVTKKTLFQGSTLSALMSEVGSDLERVVDDGFPRYYSQVLRTLTNRMLKYFPHFRPSAESVLRSLVEQGHYSESGLSASRTSQDHEVQDVLEHQTLSFQSRGQKAHVGKLPPIAEGTSSNVAARNTSSSCDSNNPKTQPFGFNLVPPISNSKPSSLSHSSQAASGKPRDSSKGSRGGHSDKRRPRRDIGHGSRDKRRRSKSVGEEDQDLDAVCLLSGDRTVESGYETDISASAESTLSEHAQPKKPHELRSGVEYVESVDETLNMLESIQKKVVDVVGQEIFMATYQILNTEDDNEMHDQLKDVLGESFKDVGPYMVFLQLLEKRMSRREDPLSKTSPF